MDARESRSESAGTPRKEMEPESTIPDTNLSGRLEDETPANLKPQKAELIGAKINQTTRRLVVNSITLDNFKSYQGKQTIGPFNDVAQPSLIAEVCFSYRSKWFRQVEPIGKPALHLRPPSEQDAAQTAQRADP